MNQTHAQPRATMAPTAPLWQRSSCRVAEDIRARRLSAEQVVTAHLDRISHLNPELNALPLVWAESALAYAREADETLATSGAVGPLHGVPFTVKANIDVAGQPTSCGTPALSDALAAVDAAPVARLREAGAIPLAQSNMPDFAFRWHTDSSAHGATVNPWHRERTPGGSSGGAAVACATGMAPFGLGNDTGGSLRQPAQCCGVSSLRPTTGRIAAAATDSSLTPALQAFCVQGVMAREVTDLQALLPVLAQRDCRDPQFVATHAEQDDYLPRRFCVYLGDEDIDNDVRAGVERAAHALCAAGYVRVDCAPPDPAGAAALWHMLISADLRHQWGPLSALMGDGTAAFLDAFLSLTPPMDSDGLLTAYTDRYTATRAWSLFQHDIPLVLTPVATSQPFAPATDVNREQVAGILRALQPTLLVNLLGLPAVVTGTGLSQGQPQAVQIIGPRFREELCLSAASTVEQMCGVLAEQLPVLASGPGGAT